MQDTNSLITSDRCDGASQGADDCVHFSRSLLGRVQVLGECLLEKQKRLFVAESCTGGALAAAITAVSGASLWFEGGAVVYENAAKHRLLSVPQSLLDRHGAVSSEVVDALVQGCFLHSDAHLALSISGVAGPGGGSVEKPVGTVWFGFGKRGDRTMTRHKCFKGDRSSIRAQAVFFAVQQLTLLAREL